MKTILQCLIALCLIPTPVSYADDVQVTKPAFKGALVQSLATDKDVTDLKKRIYPCLADEITDRVFVDGEASISQEIAERRMDAISNNKDTWNMMTLKCMVATGVIEMNTANATMDSHNQNPVTNTMSVNDVLLDYDGMVGQNHRIKGFLMSAGDINVISQAQGSMTNLLVDVSMLSRKDRKKLLSDCSQGCNMSLDGVIGKVLYGKGIKATKLWY